MGGVSCRHCVVSLFCRRTAHYAAHGWSPRSASCWMVQEPQSWLTGSVRTSFAEASLDAAFANTGSRSWASSVTGPNRRTWVRSRPRANVFAIVAIVSIWFGGGEFAAQVNRP